jgi:antitoxin (DNA-binding transcriptional repressor) of toxin-antitoxin stability system
MKTYTMTNARNHLNELLYEASIGEDIEITVYGDPYVKLTRRNPGLPCALLTNSSAAVAHWSQLLSAVANNDARFFFITPHDLDVFLVRVDGYENKWITAWEKHRTIFK